MLTAIHIRDFALIDRMDLTFSGGFTTLTGETGAGKSIIIDAISAVLGERATPEAVRTGAESALIEAVFDLSDVPAVREKAAELGIEIESDALFLSQELTSGGKSQRRINGRLSTLSTLRELSAGLLDLHGQHEHQSLLAPESHVDVLDGWLGPHVTDLRRRMSETYSALRDIQRRIEQLRTNERERAHLLDLYRFQLSEIQSAGLVEGEEEQLIADRDRLANAEKLYEFASSMHGALSGDDRGGIVSGLAQATRQAEQMAALDPSASPVFETLRDALLAAEEAQSLVRDYKDEVEFNPERLEAIQERLDLIRTLRRKYGDSVEQITGYASEIAGKVADLENSEERAQELEAELERLGAEAGSIAAELSDLRRTRSTEFEAAVVHELADLAMEGTRFKVSLESIDLSARGTDAVEFMISPNPGEPLKSLVRIASGGEMSRVMLALKSVAAADRVPTLIFDEIDTGIGGRTANVIGEKLARVALTRQVMCVTHLPQIASRATSHFSVDKQVVGERTVVRVIPLGAEERVQELVRMLGFAEDAETALAHAKELLASGASSTI